MISRAEGIALIAISLDELSYLISFVSASGADPDVYGDLASSSSLLLLLPLKLLLFITVTELDVLGSVPHRITFTP